MPRLLYVGDLGPGLTSQDRLDALRQLGADTDAIAPPTYPGLLGRLNWLLSSRLQISPGVEQLNKTIRERVQSAAYDILWLDKAWMIQPRTLRAARSRGAAIVMFNNDNPWGGHERGMWRLHKACIPLFDEIIVPKYSVTRPYQLAGARRVSIADFGFAPERHYRPSAFVAKEYDLCFIGTALRDGGGIRQHRTSFIRQLARLMPGRIAVFGHGWQKALRGDEANFRIIKEGGAWDDAYRETIWKSKINLSFITRDNWEESSHRAFEITASGGCLLAERSSRLEESFAENSEAAFFHDVADCAETASRLLKDDALRETIARQGCQRATSSGYDNASRLRGVIVRSPVLQHHFPHLDAPEGRGAFSASKVRQG